MISETTFSAATLRKARSKVSQRALVMLNDAQETALELKTDPMQFALQLNLLLKERVSENVLRWLVASEFVEHQLEIGAAKGKRRFHAAPSLQLLKRSCFVLTPLGLKLAQKVLPREILADAKRDRRKPRYDRKSRTLWLVGAIVKQFTSPAGNQGLILQAFQEDGWKAQIDDPLPPVPGSRNIFEETA